MRTIFSYTITLLFLGLLTVHPSIAGEPVQTFEMGESGQTVEFKLSPKEIAAKLNGPLGHTDGNQTATGKTTRREKIFEMGESGQFVSFPMTAKEIAAEDAQKALSGAVPNRKAIKDGRKTVIFELAESGQTIEFPVKIVEILIDDVALTDVSEN